MSSTSRVTVDTLRRFLDAFNRHDLDDVMSYFADECELEMPRGPEPWGERYRGKNAVRAGLATRFEGLPDAHWGADSHWLGGDFGVSEWTLTGTRPDGSPLRVRGTDHLQFRDGKVARKDSYWKIVEP